jgi:hypothetical protein
MQVLSFPLFLMEKRFRPDTTCALIKGAQISSVARPQIIAADVRIDYKR